MTFDDSQACFLKVRPPSRRQVTFGHGCPRFPKTVSTTTSFSSSRHDPLGTPSFIARKAPRKTNSKVTCSVRQEKFYGNYGEEYPGRYFRIIYSEQAKGNYQKQIHGGISATNRGEKEASLSVPNLRPHF